MSINLISLYARVTSLRFSKSLNESLAMVASLFFQSAKASRLRKLRNFFSLTSLTAQSVTMYSMFVLFNSKSFHFKVNVTHNVEVIGVNFLILYICSKFSKFFSIVETFLLFGNLLDLKVPYHQEPWQINRS